MCSLTLRRSDQPGPADAGRALHDRLVQLLPAGRARVLSVPVWRPVRWRCASRPDHQSRDPDIAPGRRCEWATRLDKADVEVVSSCHYRRLQYLSRPTERRLLDHGLFPGGTLGRFHGHRCDPWATILLRSAQPRHGEQPTSAFDRGQRRTAARPELDFNRDGHADADADPYIHADTNRDGHADADADRYIHADANPDCEAGGCAELQAISADRSGTVRAGCQAHDMASYRVILDSR